MRAALLLPALLCGPPAPAWAEPASPGRRPGAVPVGTLSNSARLPLLGLGCSSGLRKPHVESALRQGYRLLDTAQATQWGYNEADVGDAVLASGVPRAQVFIQTKIHPEDLGYAATLRAFPGSLDRLRTDYVDALLIHKPRCWKEACQREPEGTWQDSWRALERLYEEGQARAIGICDVDDALLDELLQQRQRPHLVQNWMDPFRQDKHIRARCKAEGIQYQAYSTLGTQWVFFKGYAANPVLENSVLQEIAAAHKRSVPQVVLNWAVNQGVAVIPASKDPERQLANLRSLDFRLTPEEVRRIDALDGTLDGQQPPAAAAADAAAAEGRVDVFFQNGVTVPLDAFFVDSGGAEQQVGSIAPGETLGQRTHIGHNFRFKLDGQVLQEHTVTGAERVTLRTRHSDL